MADAKHQRGPRGLPFPLVLLALVGMVFLIANTAVNLGTTTDPFGSYVAQNSTSHEESLSLSLAQLPLDPNLSLATSDPFPWNYTDLITNESVPDNRPAIVVMLRGELGNQLSRLAGGVYVQWRALHNYGISAQLVLKHQNHFKWNSAMENTKACFPNTRPMNFSAANNQEFDILQQHQNDWLGHTNSTRLSIRDDFQFDQIDQTLQYWKDLLATANPPLVPLQHSIPVSLPFLSIDAYTQVDFVDKTLDVIRPFFTFDDVACCNQIPDVDETVVPIRNFVVEMPRKGKQLGFEQLSPNKTAFELLQNLNQGDKVAITSRYGGAHLHEYVTAMEARGLKVRVIENQTAVQDFCFLLRTRKELVGQQISTFAAWPAYIGDMAKARLYSIDSPFRRQILGDNYTNAYNLTHPALKQKLILEEYNSEEQDVLEAIERDTTR